MSRYSPFDEESAKHPRVTLREENVPGRRPSGGGGGGDLLYNILTIFFGLGTIGVIAAVILILRDPYAAYNPFPPDTPTPTPTLILIPGINAPVVGELTPLGEESLSMAAEDPAITITPAITLTAPPTPTRSAAGPGPISTQGLFTFILQNDAVTYIQNEGEDGCAWQAIAGQVFDLAGAPVTGLPVQVQGEDFEQIAFSGTAEAYGASGYEIYLGPTPLEREYVVRLLSTTGAALSEAVVVRTLASCDRNVAIVNFAQSREVEQ